MAHYTRLECHARYLKTYIFNTLLIEPLHVFSLPDLATEINSTPGEIRDAVSVLVSDGFVTEVHNSGDGEFQVVLSQAALRGVKSKAILLPKRDRHELSGQLVP